MPSRQRQEGNTGQEVGWGQTRPVYPPGTDDELTTTLGYVEQQLDAIRAAAFGLTQEQFRATPCRSPLSVGALIKHTGSGLRGAAARLSGDPDVVPLLDPDAFAAHEAGLSVTAEETAEEILTEFDAARSEFGRVARTIDPDAQALASPAPWHGVFDPRPMRWRYYLTHIVEELARHAGHADIIREQLDDQAVPSLVMSVDGAPANDFFTPYVPAPGTIGAT